jgi:hypothetical protein
MRIFDRIEFWHNKASDTNFVWFPFLFLKPRPEVFMRATLKLKMTLCFGVYYGIFAGIRNWLFSGGDLLSAVGKDIFLAIVIFGIWFHLVTAPIWNVRARRLKSRMNINT